MRIEANPKQGYTSLWNLVDWPALVFPVSLSPSAMRAVRDMSLSFSRTYDTDQMPGVRRRPRKGHQGSRLYADVRGR